MKAVDNADSRDKLVSRYRKQHDELTATRVVTNAESPAPISDNRLAYSVTETAVLLGLSVRTVERLIGRKEIRVRRIGRRVLVPIQELGAWLNPKE